MKKSKESNFTFQKLLSLYVLVPLIVVSLILGLAVIIIANSQIKKQVYSTMVSSICQIGNNFDYITETNGAAMAGFAEAPIIKEYLRDPNNAELGKKAQQYTLDYFETLDGFEAIYIATWESLVLTHPVSAVIGKPTRDGESLKNLQDAMLASGGVYNTGIITSPASGNQVMSLYYPIMDGNKPIGFVGAATYVDQIAGRISDISKLNLDTGYVYFVNNKGTMLSHPDPEKIGKPVENEAVKKVVAQLEAGEHPEPACVDYVYKGKKNYASYYVGKDEAYVAILTADESEVLAAIKYMKDATFIIVICCIVAFSTLSLSFAKVVAKPLTEVAKGIQTLGTGNLNVNCKTSSHVKETLSLVNGFNTLKKELQSSIGKVKESAEVLNAAIISVDDMTAGNVEAISQISDAITEVASTSQTIAYNTQNMAKESVELESRVENLNQNVSVLFDASQTIQVVNRDAAECMSSVYEGAKGSVEAVQSISEKVKETNTAIENVSKAISVIESIAGQTNLLSLNASIEAARAGEAGAGFAVVAMEIRNLADSSATAAKEIKGIIDNITTLSNETVDISNQVFEVIIRAQEDIETTQVKFNELLDSVELSLSEISKVKTMAVELDEIKTEMASHIMELSAISEELGASSEEVAASCQEVTGACTNTQASTEEMRAINENMIEAIDFFQL